MVNGRKRERQTTPARERLARDAVVRLLRVADSVRRSMDRAFAPFGVTGQQYNLLRILGGATEPLPTMEVASRMLEKTPGVTGLLDRLESKGLVRRERSERDRRIWLCSITRAGRELLRRMDRPVRDANLAAVRGAKDAELEALTAVLNRIAEARDREG